MGAAIRDYFRQGKSAQLKVLSSLFDDDEMPVAHLFRSYHEMPPLEQRALNEPEEKCLMSVLALVAMPWPCRSVVLTSRLLIYRP